MREYKICKGDLGYHICRTKTENDLTRVEWLQNDGYTLNREHAKIFYNIGDATSAFIIAKRRGKTDTTLIKKSESEEHKEKTSWSEL